ncbi:MAG: sulfotransferase domain-containing protein, partial [Deltaproteobacteria bacterium]|nr:sulfotransferase domain-containing protein [Deltaproteobacteria bacterium]
ISDMLRQHPEVFLPEEKELQFFNEYNLFGEKRAWRYKIHGIKYYQKLFTDSNENQIKGEFSNQYMQEEKVSQYIHDTFPEIKIIAVLRNPVDRAYSAYWYFREMLNNIERLTTFEEAIEKNPKEYLERGKYYKKLKPYYRLFPVKNIHIILHDNIKENPEKVLP